MLFPFSFWREWSPTDHPGLLSWWRAEDAYSDTLGTPATIGQPIRRIPDLSGNGRHLNQTTGSFQPTLEYFNGTDGGNGLAFATNHLVGSNLATSAVPWPVKRTIIIVADISAPLSTNVICQFAPSNGNPGAGFIANGPGGGVLRTDTSTGHVQWFDTADGLYMARGRVSILAQHGITLGDLKAWRNNSPVTITNGETVGAPGDGSPSVLFSVGARSNGSVGVTGRIAEVLVYSGYLNDPARARVHAYLQRRYAL